MIDLKKVFIMLKVIVVIELFVGMGMMVLLVESVRLKWLLIIWLVILEILNIVFVL